MVDAPRSSRIRDALPEASGPGRSADPSACTPITLGPLAEPRAPLQRIIGHFTIELILKIGRMIAIAMNPTTEPITMIIMGSIIDVTALIRSFSSFA